MCVMCNEGNIEDVFRILHLQIVDRGFAIVPVGTRTENKGWAYTIGLIDSKDHPELIVAGYPLDRAVDVIYELGAAVMAGDRLGSPGRLAIHGFEIGARAVDERHLRGDLIAGWHFYYDTLGRYDLVPRALQVVLPDGGRCFEHQTTQPRLDDRRHVPFDGPNRQQRRARRGARHRK
jgi:Domain of unknown function (DUF4262)